MAVVAATENSSSCKSIQITRIKKTGNEGFLEEVKFLVVKLRLPVPSAQDNGMVHRLPSRVGTVPSALISFTAGRMRDFTIPKRV